MPLYRYICQNCQKEYTLLKSIKDPEATCPNCGQKMERQIPRIQIKGNSSGSSCSSNSCSGCSGCSSHS